MSDTNSILCPKCGTSVSIADVVHESMQHERRAIEDKVRQEVERANTLVVGDLKKELDDKSKKLDVAARNELELRRHARDLEEKEKLLDLELERKLDAERTLLAATIRKQFDESLRRSDDEHRLREAESAKRIEVLLLQLDEAKRRAQQGSQQLQGEVLELEIEEMLKQLFPTDNLLPVKTGVRGADVVHTVLAASGQSAGTILWETKRHKNWSDSWLEKLREDQREAGAEVAVIVSTVMPKDCIGIVEREGIWVCTPTLAAGLAHILRTHVLQVHQARNAARLTGTKMEILHEYLTGTAFRQRIEAIVEIFRSMQEELDREKRSAIRGWSVREQQIGNIATQVCGMAGDLQGILGSGFPTIKSLEWEPSEVRSLPKPKRRGA